MLHLLVVSNLALSNQQHTHLEDLGKDRQNPKNQFSRLLGKRPNRLESVCHKVEPSKLAISPSLNISMDGKGRWMDNVFVERLWRSVKYEEIYLKEHTIPELHRGLQSWFDRYNHWRPHTNLGNLTPARVYQSTAMTPKAA